jgi:hypothetical protein
VATVGARTTENTVPLLGWGLSHCSGNLFVYSRYLVRVLHATIYIYYPGSSDTIATRLLDERPGFDPRQV